MLALFFLLMITAVFGNAGAYCQSKDTPLQPLVKLGPIPAGAQFDATGHLDAEKATRAYLDTIPADKKAASNKYFEGKYWLLLWDALFSIVLMLILLFSGLSRRMRDLAAKCTRFKWLQTWIYFAEFSILTTVVGLPVVSLGRLLPRAYVWPVGAGIRWLA